MSAHRNHCRHAYTQISDLFVLWGSPQATCEKQKFTFTPSEEIKSLPLVTNMRGEYHLARGSPVRTTDTVPLPLRTRRTRFSPVDNIDLLRLVAVVLVTGQHALSLLGRDDLTTVIGVNIGQVGVDLFLGISALLAVQDVRPPARWLAQRLTRIYPAYWLAMALSFSLTWASGHKAFGAGQFWSQMIGTGLFTHPMNLVNVPTWFISLLLTCYIGVFTARLSGVPGLLYVACAALVSAWVVSGIWPWWPAVHLLTFVVVCALMVLIPDRTRPAIMAATAAAMAVAVRAVPELVCPAVSLFLIASALTLRPVSIPTVRQLNACTYEYYLVHGIFLNLAVLLLSGHPILAVASGVLLASAGAIRTATLRHNPYRIGKLIARSACLITRRRESHRGNYEKTGHFSKTLTAADVNFSLAPLRNLGGLNRKASTRLQCSLNCSHNWRSMKKGSSRARMLHGPLRPKPPHRVSTR